MPVNKYRYYDVNDFIPIMPKIVEVEKDILSNSIPREAFPELQEDFLSEIVGQGAIFERKRRKEFKDRDDVDIETGNGRRLLQNITIIDFQEIDRLLPEMAKEMAEKHPELEEYSKFAVLAWEDYKEVYLIPYYLQKNGIMGKAIDLPEGEIREDVLNRMDRRSVESMTLDDIKGLNMSEYKALIDKWESDRLRHKLALFKVKERTVWMPEMEKKEAKEAKKGTTMEKFAADLFRIDDEPEPAENAGTVKIPLEKLVEYRDHKFKLIEGDALEELKRSIEQIGVINPVIIQPKGAEYEILSGHNRVNAVRKLKEQYPDDPRFETVPAVIKTDLSEDEALEIVLETNFNQRSMSDMSVSEQAAVVAQYNDLMKKMKRRTEIVVTGDEEIVEDGKSTSEKFSLSKMQISRYVRINSLQTSLKALIDAGKLFVEVGAYLHKLKPESQDLLAEYLVKNKIDVKKAQELTLADANKALDTDYLDEFFKKEKGEKSYTVKFDEVDIARYCDSAIDKRSISRIVKEALEVYVQEHGLLK